MPQPSLARVHEAEVVSNVRVAEGLWRLVVKSPVLAAKLSPGQFMSVAVPGEPLQVSRVPLSYVTCDFDAGTVETVYMVVGPGTEALSRMEPGSTTTILGPGGHGWKLDAFTKRCLLVAGGVGVTPIASAAQALGLQGLAYDVVVGARTGNALWGVDRFLTYGADHVVVVTDDGTAGAKGLTTDALEAALPEERYDLVLVCGPEPMMRKCAELCAEYEVACQVSMERMMTCGFGACATCVVPTVNGAVGACMGGPVMNAAEVVW